MPTFHEYASDWLQAKKGGVLGDRPISANSAADYRSRLANHLLPFFGQYRLDEIDAELCLAFKAHKLKEAADLRRAIEAGAVLRDRRGRRARPLGTKLPVRPAVGSTAAKVAERWESGMRPKAIAADLGLARAAVTHHLRRLQAEQTGPYAGRRAIVAPLGGSGARVSELCDIRIGDLRLSAASGAHFRIPDAKTEAGVREVQVSPDLLEELVTHLDRLRRVGVSTSPDSHLFPSTRGGAHAAPARRADRRRGGSAGLHSPGRARPARTPEHDSAHVASDVHLDRAARQPVRRPLGHADSKMTMDVFAQLQQRAERPRRGLRCAGPTRARAAVWHGRRREPRVGGRRGRRCETRAGRGPPADEPGDR